MSTPPPDEPDATPEPPPPPQEPAGAPPPQQQAAAGPPLPPPPPAFAPVPRAPRVPWVNPARRSHVTGAAMVCALVALGAGIGIGVAIGSSNDHHDRAPYPMYHVKMLPMPRGAIVHVPRQVVPMPYPATTTVTVTPSQH